MAHANRVHRGPFCFQAHLDLAGRSVWLHFNRSPMRGFESLDRSIVVLSPLT
jgi:hypothetical protein